MMSKKLLVLFNFVHSCHTHSEINLYIHFSVLHFLVKVESL